MLEAGNSREALKLFEGYAASIDLLLSDVEMPGMSGIELARQTSVEWPDVRVLLYSANLSLAEGAGFPLLSKPFLPKALLNSVSNALQSPPHLQCLRRLEISGD